MTTNRERRPQPARRQVLRVDAQDGPWTVSVAENHHRPSSYTLYIKSECPFTKNVSEVFVALLGHVTAFDFVWPSKVTLLRFTPLPSLT